MRVKNTRIFSFMWIFKKCIIYPKLHYNSLLQIILKKNMNLHEYRNIKHSNKIIKISTILYSIFLECNRCIKIINGDPDGIHDFHIFTSNLSRGRARNRFLRSSLRGKKLIRGIARAISHPLSPSIPSSFFFFFSFHWVVHTFTDPNPWKVLFAPRLSPGL